MDRFGLKNGVLDAVIDVLKGNPGVHKSTIFGSRAKGNYRRCSDIDIAIYGDIDALDAERLICDLDELPTAHTFDVAVYDLINNPALREHIERVGVPIYERAEPELIVCHERGAKSEKGGGDWI